MKVKELKDIATVSMGVAFRSRIEPSRNGDVTVIQMKDLGKDNRVHSGHAVCVDYVSPKRSQIAQIDDLVFRSRGLTNTAAIVVETFMYAIVAAPLLHIRPDRRQVIPAFLQWWINQASSQNYLRSRAEGSVLKMVSANTLRELPITLPPLERQQKIADFYKCSIEEQALLEKLKDRKARYTQEILMQMTSKSGLAAMHKKPDFNVATSTSGQIHLRARS